MFIDVEIKKSGQHYSKKPIRVNLDNVEIIEFDEKEMVFIDGKLDIKGTEKISRNMSPYSSYKKNMNYKKQLVKIT